MNKGQAGYKNEDAACSSDAVSPDSLQIIKAIAEYEEMDPLELDFVLGEHIDTEALERVLDADVEYLQVSFTINGVAVSVASDGTIMIADAE